MSSWLAQANYQEQLIQLVSLHNFTSDNLTVLLIKLYKINKTERPEKEKTFTEY